MSQIELLREAENQNYEITRESWKSSALLFDEISGFYKNIKTFSSFDTETDEYFWAQNYLWSSCYSCAVNGALTLMRGHMNYSLFYLRQSVEAIQSSIFLSRNKHLAKQWCSEDTSLIKDYQRKQGKWFYDEGRVYLEKQYPHLVETYEYCSYMVHPNFCSHVFQTAPISDSNKLGMHVHFSDIPSRKHSHLWMGLGLKCHLEHQRDVMDWWTSEIFVEQTNEETMNQRNLILKKIDDELNKWEIKVSTAKLQSSVT